MPLSRKCVFRRSFVTRYAWGAAPFLQDREKDGGPDQSAAQNTGQQPDRRRPTLAGRCAVRPARRGERCEPLVLLYPRRVRGCRRHLEIEVLRRFCRNPTRGRGPRPETGPAFNRKLVPHTNLLGRSAARCRLPAYTKDVRRYPYSTGPEKNFENSSRWRSGRLVSIAPVPGATAGQRMGATPARPKRFGAKLSRCDAGRVRERGGRGFPFRFHGVRPVRPWAPARPGRGGARHRRGRWPRSG